MLTSNSSSLFTDYNQEQLMEWHPGRVKRTRTRVIGVIFSDFLIKGKEFSSSWWEIQVILVQVDQVKMTEKWG